MAKKTKVVKEKSIEDRIWDSANKLRGNLTASEYQNVVLGLVFLKYISDCFEKRYKELIEEGDGFEEDRDEYTAEHVFWVPQDARWNVIVCKAHSPEIGQVIDHALEEIGRENPRLKKVMPNNYSRPEIDKIRLGEVVEIFDNMDMHAQGEGIDLFGRVYEYCLQNFAANPPFNMSEWGTGRLADDVRWKYGVPPEGNANYAWIQHMVHHLSPTGRIGLVLANGSLTTTTGGEGEIRRRLIEADLVEGVIAMSNQLFYNVSIPVCVWFFNRKKKNPGKVLFIDAREMGMMVDRTHRELSDDFVRYDTVKKEDKPWASLPADECDVQRIAATFRAYENGILEDVKGFCKVATIEEIGKQDWVLTPGRYVGIADEEEDAEPFEEKMARLTAELGDLFAESHRLEAGIREKLAGIGFNVK